MAGRHTLLHGLATTIHEIIGLVSKNSPDIPLLISLEGMSRPDVSRLAFLRVYESQFSWVAAADIFLGNRGIYKTVFFCLKAQASKDLQKNAQTAPTVLVRLTFLPGEQAIIRFPANWADGFINVLFHLVINHWRHTAACPGINFKRAFHVKSF